MAGFPFRAGASALLLLSSTSAFAQQAETDTTTTDSSEIDALVPDDNAAAAAPAPTGDPVLDRLNALEAKVKSLEARNRQLEELVETTQGRVQNVEVRAAKGVQPGVAPTFADTAGQFSFKVRGVIDVDQVAFNERAGGYDYNNGTGFRRARLGFEGTAFKDFNWRIEADFAGNTVNLQDAYLQYNGIKKWQFTLGQHKAPFSLESNNSDNFNTFLERGMFNVAAGGLGAERRIGLSAAYLRDNFTATVGLFGENESIGRDATVSAVGNRVADEGWGVNGRVTWEPVYDTGKILHVGASGFWRTALRSGDNDDSVRLSERPNIRVDNGLILDSGVIPSVDRATYYGVEAAGILGPLSVVGEYGRVSLERQGALSNPDFDGFYVYGSWFLTGESRPFKNGNFDRLKPLKNFDSKGGWGAWELALRYDEADFSETPVVIRAGNKANTWTGGVNWYLNPNFKLQFNYIRFEGDNTPLDPVGAKTKGDVFATRLHLDW